jgi:hypothetical protein
MILSAGMKPLSALMLLAAVAGGCTFTSGTLATGESPYVDVAAGAEVYFDSPPKDAAATFDMKLGYRWPRIAVDAALVWTHDIRWDAAQCEPEFECMSEDNRDLVGIRGALQYYPLDGNLWLQPYLIFGVGIRAMHYHRTVWAGLFQLGAGFEAKLVGGLSLNVAVMYSVTRFDKYIGSPEGETNQSIQPMGGLRFYF